MFIFENKNRMFIRGGVTVPLPDGRGSGVAHIGLVVNWKKRKKSPNRSGFDLFAMIA